MIESTLKMQQQIRMIPEQIQRSEILQMSRFQLEQHLENEFVQNPALEIIEEITRICPVCDSQIDQFPCPSCGYKPASMPDEIPTIIYDDWGNYHVSRDDSISANSYEGIASKHTLQDYIRGQWSVVAEKSERTIGNYLIDCLDEEGYLKEPLFEIATHFRISVPQLEIILKKIQNLEPAGIGARDLQECLLLQCDRLDPTELEDLPVRLILEKSWEDFITHRWSKIQKSLHLTPLQVEEAVQWIKENLAPFPGRVFQDNWAQVNERLCFPPDAIIEYQTGQFTIKLVESRLACMSVNPDYELMNLSSHKSANHDSEKWDEIHQAILHAKFLVRALAQRRQTFYKVIKAVVHAQSEFLLKGPAFLKPLMQKDLAKQIGIHESTVCRALSNKFIRIPSGEMIPAIRFFDDSIPVKNALKHFIQNENPKHPISDSQLAQLLQEAGFQVARRTVAKYRDILHIPPVSLRQVAR